MKILLISFQKDLDTLGLKYLHYYLLGHGHMSEILYLPSFNKSEKGALEKIKQFIIGTDPGLIGISLMSTEYHNACELTRYIKSFGTNTPIVWGGIHPTISPESCLGLPDYICVGEGERTMLDIANAVVNNTPINRINNICCLENGEVRKNPLYPLIEDLDEIPSYEHIPRSSFILHGGDIVPLKRETFEKYDRFYGRAYTILTTRGCPYSCTFCCGSFLSRLYGSNKLRRRSVTAIIDELEQALRDNPRIQLINFQDDCFLAHSEKHLENFCRQYKDKISKPFAAKAMPAYMTRAKLELLKYSGLAWIQMGLQSGSDKVCRDIYKRKSTREDFLRAARIINELRIAPQYDVILDNPFETEDDRLQTVYALARTPKPFYTQFYSLVFYPGTELYEASKTSLPGHMEDCSVKNYFALQKNVMNDLTRLASFFDAGPVAWLTNLYKKAPASARFRISLFIFNLVGFLVVEPLNCFRVVKLSQGGSLVRTLTTMPVTLREWAARKKIS